MLLVLELVIRQEEGLEGFLDGSNEILKNLTEIYNVNEGFFSCLPSLHDAVGFSVAFGVSYCRSNILRPALMVGAYLTAVFPEIVTGKNFGWDIGSDRWLDLGLVVTGYGLGYLAQNVKKSMENLRLIGDTKDIDKFE